MSKKILLSGVKPSGSVHLGNYFGAMKQFVDLQKDYQPFIFIADYHALTTIKNKEAMEKNSFEIALDYLAIGLEPENVTFYKQSSIPEHTELAWIFNCITTMPYLMRAHAFKDSEAKNKEINVGVFDYPMLMSADILLYDPDIVPVGQDQKQHVEFARDTATKFNRIFGEAFKLPEPMILDSMKTIPGIDGQKMSKSYNNTIPLFASNDEIQKLVMGIVTDSDSEVPENVKAIHSLLIDQESLERLYTEKAGKYKDLKEALIADLISFVTPLRERREALISDKKKVLSIIEKGTQTAKVKAEEKMKKVKELIGVLS